MMQISNGYQRIDFWLICLLVLPLMTLGCVETIIFDTNRSGGQLVVHGKITDQAKIHYLKLGITREEKLTPEPVSGAKVKIFRNGAEEEPYHEIEPGLYELRGDVVKGERGGTYHIRIEIPDGRVYRSIPEKMADSTAKTEILLELGYRTYESSSGRTIKERVINVNGKTQKPELSEPAFKKLRVESFYIFQEMFTSPLAPQKICYITENVSSQRINLMKIEPDSKEIGTQLLAVKSFEPYQFAFRHFFNVYVYSITERRYRYWEQADQIINRTGTIFDLMPANVKGNVINEADSTNYALGYFEASSVSISRKELLPKDFNMAIPNPCPNFEGVANHFACTNCLLLENSTDQRPDFLDDM